MSKVVLKDIVPCRKADLMSGFHLILFHVNRVPPHLGIVYKQKYYSLTASECQIGIDFDPIWRLIRSKKIETIVIVGMTTNHCISTTVRMSGNLGYETYLISDSTACYNTIGLDGKEIDCNVIFNSAMASLKNEFAEIISSKELFSLVT